MKKNNEDIRQLDRDGCVIIKVGDKELRKDRLDKISASLKVRRKNVNRMGRKRTIRCGIDRLRM